MTRKCLLIEYCTNTSKKEHQNGFLNACELEPFQQITECYLCSLKRIKSTETSQRCEKAQNLFDKYKEAGIRFTSFTNKNIENGM
ncbi:hypothetical protein RhiirA5_414350 [Rhizophagus irregularis]|uniref:Uncharacterized protein n=1 Tax=Rhizophagus irregularis TaxID=588596 RepID=A0A2N0PUD0_9GLOM|nr:hypothetical protein RhiirA5_414350 [Rhizophagus irregularis]